MVNGGWRTLSAGEGSLVIGLSAEASTQADHSSLVIPQSPFDPDNSQLNTPDLVSLPRTVHSGRSDHQRSLSAISSCPQRN